MTKAARILVFTLAAFAAGEASALEPGKAALLGVVLAGPPSGDSDEARAPSAPPAPRSTPKEAQPGAPSGGSPEASRPSWGLEPSVALVWESFDQAYGSATGSSGTEYAAGKFVGSGIGIRGTSNGFGLALYKTTGYFKEAGATTPNFDLTSVAVTYAGGSKVLWSAKDAPIKLGFVYPEAVFKLSWGSREQVDILNYTIGLSVIGLRGSYADRFFLELRLLQLAYEMQKATFPLGGGPTESLLANKFNVAAAPSLRIGVSF